MGSDEKISLSDAIVDKIKKNKFVVIVVALGTIASAGSAIIALWHSSKDFLRQTLLSTRSMSSTRTRPHSGISREYRVCFKTS
jgi:flagellar basal body-associated protein FliL